MQQLCFTSRVALQAAIACAALALVAVGLGCRRAGKPPIIAVIPQVAPEQIWLDEHAGVLRAAAKSGVRIYWNAPDREDDVQRQISLVDQVAAGEYMGLVLAPAQELALMLPVQRVLARHLPVVIVSSPLTLTPGTDLAYIVNDEDETGALAARTIGETLHGKGRVALLGIDPMQVGMMNRMRAFEDHLHREFPAIRITERKLGSADALSSEQIAAEALMATPHVDAALALDITAAIGIYQAEQQPEVARRVAVVACGQDSALFTMVRNGAVQALIAQDSFSMGYQAVDDILRMRKGMAVPARTAMKPIFITAANVNDPQILARVANLPDEPL